MTVPSTFILAPFGALYGAGVRVRRAMYETGVFSVHKINAPVLSVGNLTTGGTGKTPMVEWIARRLQLESEQSVCILSRGYGRADAHERVVVSDGKNILADARTGGDEPRLLAEMLLDVGVAVISDIDRVNAAKWAQAALHSEIFVLDDGFQHLSLARDLDIVMIDGIAPFKDNHLLPRGSLREPLSALARADCIIITRADEAHDIAALRSEIACVSNNRTVIVSRTRTRALRALNDTNALAAEDLRSSSQPVAAFCALGNPQAFIAHLRRDNFNLCCARSFPDHHVYTQRDADEISLKAIKHDAKFLLTTAKDAVKLRDLHFTLPCLVVEIEMEFDDQEKLLELVRRAVSN